MRTTTTLLISILLMAGTILTASAEDSNRTRASKQRTEVEKRVEKATKDQAPVKKVIAAPTRTVEKKAVVRSKSVDRTDQNRNVNRSSNTSNERNIDRSNTGNGNRNDRISNENHRDNSSDYRGGRSISGNRNADYRSESQRRSVRDPREIQREQRNRERERMARGHRAPDRYFWRWENRRHDHDHYARFHDGRCRFCMGNGFTFGHNRFDRIRCNHCSGIGRIQIRFVNVHTCPLCFTFIDLNNRYEDYSLEELAWMETNRLSIALELDEYQENEIYQINLEYLVERQYNQRYTFHKRNREIRRVLDPGQRLEFNILYDEIPREFLCYRCAHL